ncbi:MAG: Tetratricopeptide repeat, partial [Candidatus Eisenbacteria bacterium]
HHDVPAALGGGTDVGAETVNRAQGVLAALLSVLAAVALARALGATGAAAATVVAVSVATGALALFNGYAKATVELAVLTLLVATGLVRGVRGAAIGFAWTGLAVAAALLLHRSALALVPAWLVAAGLAATAWPSSTRARVALVVGLLAPAASLAAVLPRLVHIVSDFDTSRHLHGGLGAALAFAATPTQWADVVNALGVLFPLVPLVPVIAVLAPRPTGRESLAWAALLLPLGALLLLTHPQHGLPRDWDVYVPVGVALAAFTATRLAALFAQEPRALRLAPAIVALALVPALQWVALQADASRTWARTRAVLLGPPLRSADERAQAFDTIGMLAMGRGRAEEARELFEYAAQAAPNPSTFVRIGMTETMLGRPADAMTHYRRAATLDPRLPTAWRGIAAAASATDDRDAMAEAVARLEQLVPDDPVLPDARAWLAAADARRADGTRR